MDTSHGGRLLSGKTTLIACAVLLAFFASIAWLAATTKNSTFDEPLHALGGWLALHEHDFRVNPEDPPLWKYWLAIPNGIGALHPDMGAPLYGKILDDVNDQWEFTVNTLYRTVGVNGEAFVEHSRAMMLVIGVALGVVIAWWGWQLGGGVTAITATLFFSFDPNFLAHAPLVKNDVSIALVTLALAWVVWRAGRRLTFFNAVGIALLCAAGVNVKFSGVLLGPIAAILLLVRALGPWAWNVLGRQLTARWAKVLAAACVCVLAAAVSYAGIWACYGFRFAPTPDPSSRMNVRRMLTFTAVNDITAREGHPPAKHSVLRWQMGAVPRAVVALERHHVLPQAWLMGFLYTYQSTLARSSFLLGFYSVTGWWYYFPLAMLYKSPIALMIAAALSAAIGFSVMREKPMRASFDGVWTLACLLLPPAIYMASAMHSNLNIGLRHVLLVYPFIYLGIGLAAKRLWRLKPAVAPRAIAVLGIALLAETLFTFPNYIAFFNVAVGGSRGGLNLLSDSNLDWGQDLKTLAAWQHEHESMPLYFIYFGTVDPWTYGIRYINLPGGYRFTPAQPFPLPDVSAILAVSATDLQGVYIDDPGGRSVMSTIRKQQPIEVLGGTIYLYHWPIAIPR